MAKPADLDLPWTRTRAASRLRELFPREDERPSEVMERVRLFLAESGARTERVRETEHAHGRQPA